MNTIVNQHKTIEEKLRMYRAPFIDVDFLKKLRDKYAYGYTIPNLVSRKLITPIKRGKTYLNLLSENYSRLLGTTIISKYFQDIDDYAIGGTYIYNQYGYTTQLANRITVYNLHHSGFKEIAGFNFLFKISKKIFFYGIKNEDAQGYGKYLCFTPERALIQLLKESNGHPEFREDIYNIINNGKVDLMKLKKLLTNNTSKNTQILVNKFLEQGGISMK